MVFTTALKRETDVGRYKGFAAGGERRKEASRKREGEEEKEGSVTRGLLIQICKKKVKNPHITK